MGMAATGSKLGDNWHICRSLIDWRYLYICRCRVGSLVNIKTTGAACQVCWSGWATRNPWTWGRRRRTCWWPRQSDFSPAALVSCHRCAVKESKVKCNCTDRRNIKGARIILSSAVLLWIEQKAFSLTPQNNESSILQLIMENKFERILCTD